LNSGNIFSERDKLEKPIRRGFRLHALYSLGIDLFRLRIKAFILTKLVGESMITALKLKVAQRAGKARLLAALIDQAATVAVYTCGLGNQACCKCPNNCQCAQKS
jgi:hypothetical protein